MALIGRLRNRWRIFITPSFANFSCRPSESSSWLLDDFLDSYYLLLRELPNLCNPGINWILRDKWRNSFLVRSFYASQLLVEVFAD